MLRMLNVFQVDLGRGLGTSVTRDSFGFSSHHSVGVRRAPGRAVGASIWNSWAILRKRLQESAPIRLP